MQKSIQLDLMSNEQLQESLSSQRRVGVDTEFMRERTFFSQLCLVQVSTGSDIYCIDPLANTPAETASAFWQAFAKVPWVLHSGRQDIEVVYQTAGVMPASVFDTQIAAALLGYAPQLGYAGMVGELFDVQLAKSHTRADWSRRPLSADVLEYAAEDVLYLLPAYEKMRERLDKLGRLGWAEQDSAELLQPALYDIDPNQAVSRLKAARGLTGTARNASVRLAAWREREALRSNRPRQWIIKDRVLIDIATSQPASADELAAIAGLAEKTARRAAGAIMAALDAANSDDKQYKPPGRPDGTQRDLLKKLQQIVSACAEDLGIATEIVSPKKDLLAAVSDEDFGGRVFRGWRAELIGTELRGLLEN